MASSILIRDTVKGEEGNIFLNDGGSGDFPLVFTHSFGGDVSHWKNQLSHFRVGRRAVAFDFRGHGRSEARPESRYTAEALANDIVAVVDGLDLEKFILVGHSMGGSAAIAYADAHPDRVVGLVLAGTPGKTPIEISREVIMSLRSDKYQQVMDDYMKKLVMNARPEVATKINAGVKKLSKETSVSIIQSMFDYDPIDKLTRYSGRKLIVQTSNEQTQPNSLHNQVPDIPSNTIDGTSHWPQLDKPDVFNNILEDFLRR
jgi:pimeloyl-ACP methyl ester carboxylesterase